MSRYYCPFCSSRYQMHETRTDGVLICKQCGDPLMKKPLINSRKIIGLFASLAFLSPLLIKIIIAIKDFTQEKKPTNSELSVLLTFKN